jgi:hypothetical protein
MIKLKKNKKFRPLYIPITLSGQRLNLDIAISQINFQKKKCPKIKKFIYSNKNKNLT